MAFNSEFDDLFDSVNNLRTTSYNNGFKGIW
jgi:hypothetical protein